MAYQRQTFTDLETVVTAEMLNHIEQGIIDNEEALKEKQPQGNYLTENTLQTAINNALAQAKSSGEFDGADGVGIEGIWSKSTSTTKNVYTVWLTDGSTYDIEVKHGTSVTVKNVSESVESGGSNIVTFSDDKTVTIKNGKDGYSPVRDTDYWTESDKAEIKSYVDEAILGGAW